ncbi:MAG: hypothetical protein GF392_04910, partial [Candidatus Omnitrophica bacterium]|nr:hypothetical protein [Candidatus Omnitrophota bacterium]
MSSEEKKDMNAENTEEKTGTGEEKTVASPQKKAEQPEKAEKSGKDEA